MFSRTAKFPDGLRQFQRGQVGKHIMAHIGAKVYAAFDSRYLNNYMGPNAQKHSLDDFNADNYDHGGLGFIRGSQVATLHCQPGRRPDRHRPDGAPPAGTPRWGAAYRNFFAKYFARHTVIISETENLPYADQTIDLDPDVRDAWGLPAPRITYDQGGQRAQERRLHPESSSVVGPGHGGDPCAGAAEPGAPGPHTQEAPAWAATPRP